MAPRGGAPSHEAGEGSNSDREHPTGQVRPARQQPAAWPGNGDHPLPKPHFGQNPVHPVSGQARHPSARARQAESATATRERNKPVVRARAAGQPGEPVLRVAARRESLQLSPHEGGQVSVRLFEGVSQLRHRLANQPVHQLGRSLPSSLHCDHGVAQCTNQAHQVALVSCAEKTVDNAILCLEFGK